MNGLAQESASFFSKGPDTIIGFAGHEACVTAVQLCSRQAAIDDMEMSVCGMFP